MIDSKRISELIEEIKSRGLAKSAIEISKACGMRENYFADIKRGATTLTASVAAKLANVYHVSPKYLSDGIPPVFDDGVPTYAEQRLALLEQLNDVSKDLIAMQRKVIELQEEIIRLKAATE